MTALADETGRHRDSTRAAAARVVLQVGAPGRTARQAATALAARPCEADASRLARVAARATVIVVGLRVHADTVAIDQRVRALASAVDADVADRARSTAPTAVRGTVEHVDAIVAAELDARTAVRAEAFAAHAPLAGQAQHAATAAVSRVDIRVRAEAVAGRLVRAAAGTGLTPLDTRAARHTTGAAVALVGAEVDARAVAARERVGARARAACLRRETDA